MNYEILINRDNLLDKEYIPEDLIIVDNNENNFHNYIDPNQKTMLNKTVYDYFILMKNAAMKEEIEIIIDSAYRSSTYQQTIFDKNVQEKGLTHTLKSVAPVGASEHQTALAIDIAYMINGKYNDDVKEDQKETIWLMNNCYKYGFILRYPKGKENITGYRFEPWHYRFVGLRLAKIIKENNITLEQYYQNKTYYDNIELREK